MHDQEFIQGSFTGRVLLGHVNLYTSPAPKIHDREFLQGLLLGHINLCTPSPSL